MTAGGPSFDLFLSYNRADADAVRKVCEAVRARGFRAFLDSDHLAAGLPWPVALERALESTRAVAVFVGASGLGVWQKREMYYALDLQARAGDFPVMPVLLAGADVPAGFVTLNTWVDLRNGITPEALEPMFQALGQGREAAVGRRELPEICPYRDLRAFREEDAALFFGREETIAKLAGVLEASVRWQERSRFVAVVGPSGSGKSSIVMAGLLPRLRRQRPPQLVWDHVSFAPADHPWRRFADVLVPLLEPQLTEAKRLEEGAILAEALRREGGVAAAVRRVVEKSGGSDRLLVVVDQFEELFTMASEETARAFVGALLNASRTTPLTVLITLRSDYYGRAVALDRELSDALPEAQVNLGPIRREELRDVVEKPASAVGLRFEEGLVDRILDDVGNEPGHLPLLEYALTELWKERSGNTLTFSAYREVGQVSGALAKRANALFDELSEAQKAAARRLMMRLVRVSAADEEGADTRRRATHAEIDDEAWKLVDFFAGPRARLLVAGKNPSGEDTAEVAHEALIRNWDRLRQWLDEDRRFLLWRQRLGLYRDAWEAADRQDEGTLLRGGVAAEAQTWLRSRRADLSGGERAFIEQSGAAVSRFRIAWRAAAAVAVAAALVSLGWYAWTTTDDYNIGRILAKGWEGEAATSALARERGPDPNLRALYRLDRWQELHEAAGALNEAQKARLERDLSSLRANLSTQTPFDPKTLRARRAESSLPEQLVVVDQAVRMAREEFLSQRYYIEVLKAFSPNEDPATLRRVFLRGLLEQIDQCTDPRGWISDGNSISDEETRAFAGDISKTAAPLDPIARALVFSTMARLHACAGKGELAAELAAKASALVPAADGEDRTHILLDLALVEVLQGDPRRAIAAALALPAGMKGFGGRIPPRPLDQVGLLFARKGDVSSALGALDAGQRRNDDTNILVGGIAEELIRQERIAEVQPFVLKHSRGGERFKMWRRSFETLVENGHVAAAARFAQAIRRDAPPPVIVDVFGDLCVIHARMGRAAEAAAAYEIAAKAAAAASADAREANRVALAIALAELGRIREARRMAESLDNVQNQFTADMGILRAYTGSAPSGLW